MPSYIADTVGPEAMQLRTRPGPRRIHTGKWDRTRRTAPSAGQASAGVLQHLSHKQGFLRTITRYMRKDDLKHFVGVGVN